MPHAQIILGDSREALKALPDASVDAVVCDPPYGLGKEPDIAEVLRAWLAGEEYATTGGGFMGKDWDAFVPGPAVWRECFRVLKPGGHLLAFFGTRTSDMGSVAIRLAGFQIRDLVAWVYGQGMPKSLDVSKAIDKAAGVERKVVGVRPGHEDFVARTDAHSAGARRDGWDRPWKNDPAKVLAHHLQTAPATEAAQEWDGWATALKPALEPVVMARKPIAGTVVENVLTHGTGALNIGACRVPGAPDAPRTTPATVNGNGRTMKARERTPYVVPEGRWPANLIHSGEPDAIAGLGDFARYFYCGKATKADKGPDNDHVTVKPQALMRWLARLVTRPGGTILDPFAGSGSTGVAALSEGFSFIGVERDPHYHAIAERRLALAQPAMALAA